MLNYDTAKIFALPQDCKKTREKMRKKIRNSYNQYKLSSINVKNRFIDSQLEILSATGTSFICKKEWERD